MSSDDEDSTASHTLDWLRTELMQVRNQIGLDVETLNLMTRLAQKLYDKRKAEDLQFWIEEDQKDIEPDTWQKFDDE